MTPKQQREEISKAYVHAVAARCGFKVGNWSQDAGCIDVSIAASGVVGAGAFSDPQIDLQLKASDDPRHILQDGRVACTLRHAHHEQLIAARSIAKLLVVLILPRDAGQWITHSPDSLILRRCAWWKRMTGEAPIPPSPEGYVTVHLPPAQHFSPEALQGIMQRVSMGSPP